MSPTTIPGNFVLQSPAANDPLLDLNTQPSLDLQFATSKTLDDRVSGQNLITFSRSTTGTYVDSNGIIQTAAIDAPRFDHDPTTNASLGLLIEESRTNIQINSEDSTGYATLEITPTVPGSVSSPDGQLNANIITPTATLNSHHLNLVNSNATNLAVSVYAKANTYRYLVMAGRGSNTASASPVFDLQSGTVTEVAGSVWSASITPAGDNWYRCSIVATSGSGGAVVGVVDTATRHNGVFLADGTSNLYVWGFQVEESASFPTSYIPTSGSTVTRAADVASITGSNFSRWYNQSEGTVFTDKTFTINNGHTYYFTDSTLTTNRFRLQGITHSGNNSSDGSFFQASVANNKTAIGLQTDNVSVNGGTPDTSFTLPSSLDRLFIGRHATVSSYLNGHISRLTYYPYRLPDATLQEITL